MEVLFQGAESKITVQEYLGITVLVKERFPKRYRNEQLDKQLTLDRIRAECRNIVRAKQAGVRTPTIYHVDLNTRLIYMEYFKNSVTAKQFINQLDDNSDSDQQRARLVKQIGEGIGKMHSKGIIHGDLTSSNMLIVDEDVVFIDFGLSSTNASAEDKAVDLYVLERALASTHANIEESFQRILEAYRRTVGEQAKEIMSKFEDVRARGRKRTMVG